MTRRLSSADSQTASASSNGTQPATSASAFSIVSSTASGCRGTIGCAQCTTAFGSPVAASVPMWTVLERGGAATCGRSGASSTHRPIRWARVTHEMTTPARVADSSSGSAPGSATQPFRGRTSSRASTARRTARSLQPS